MRIHRVQFSDFKGVSADIPWAPAMVLFGANDSGKTNLLEAFLSTFGARENVRQDDASPLAYVRLEVELDGLELEGHPDQEIFLSWFLAGNTGVDWCLGDEDLAQHKDVLEDVHARIGELSRENAASPWRSPPKVAALVQRTLNTIREAWDSLISAGADFSEAGIRRGEEAASSRYFRLCSNHVEWLPQHSDLRDHPLLWVEMTELPHGGWPALDCFFDAPAIRVIPVGVASDTLAVLRNQLEVLLPRLIEQHGGPEVWGPMAVHLLGIAKDGSGDAWGIRDGDSYVLRESMAKACQGLSARITELAPPFVSASYAIRLVPLSPVDWSRAGGHHVAVQLCTRDGARSFNPELSSSGVAGWTSLALAEAVRMTQLELEPRSGPTIYVFDEPEAHLHPAAQKQAAAWVAERVRSGANMLLATHSVPFLDLPLADTEYFKVTRAADWTTQVTRISGDILGAVAEDAESMGLPPMALLQLTRAWLVVEGEHDRRILDAFFGRELQGAGIQLVPLRGAARAKASFLNLGALAPLGVPFCVLLDNARAAAVRAGQIPRHAMSEEEHIVAQLVRLEREEGIQLSVFGLPYPDIVCALPFEAVREVARENKGKPEAAASWSEFLGRYDELRRGAQERREKAPDFKRFVLEELGVVGLGADRLVGETLAKCDGQQCASVELARLVSEIVARVDAGHLAMPALPADETA